MAKKTKNDEITIDDVRNEMLNLFHRLIKRLEKLTNDCEDPSTINQAIKTMTDFLVKLNKERDTDDESFDAMLRQTLKGIEGN